MKDDEKIRFIRSSALEALDNLETLLKVVKWMKSDLKYIEKITRPKGEPATKINKPRDGKLTRIDLMLN